ncbi:MAG TPA: zinc-binding dehydrogenase [Candidatus Sulfotelmatobacter sp.]|nr:zinc-binding dehydrogenase [Candidatus Sulfotelmatobacter sp.]
MTPIPATMRAVQLRAYDGNPESVAMAELRVPRPGPGQVLVRVAASPINPSDQMFIRGLYGFKKPLPATPGFEGSGTAVEAGSGMMARFLKGRRVACAAADPNVAGGMWAEYVVTSAQLCVPLSKRVDMEQGATMLVNPLTAWALMEEARLGRHRAVVQTAAASALGRMLVRLGRRFSVPIINVVRRAEQAELLRKMGADHVLNTSDADFDASLEDLCHKLGATMGFDAVAGEMSARVLRAQPRGSRLLVYGALSLEASQVDPASLIFEGKRAEGFWLTAWLSRKSIVSRFRVSRQVQGMLAGDLKTEIQARLPLEEVARALEQYAANMTGGKILLIPSRTAEG